MPEPKLPLKLETCLSDLKNSLSEAFNTVRDDYMGYVWGDKQSDLATNLMGKFGVLMADIRSRLDPSVRTLQADDEWVYDAMQDILEQLNDALKRIEKQQGTPPQQIYKDYYEAVNDIKNKIENAAVKLRLHMDQINQSVEKPLETKTNPPSEIVQPDN